MKILLDSLVLSHISILCTTCMGAIFEFTVVISLKEDANRAGIFLEEYQFAYLPFNSFINTILILNMVTPLVLDLYNVYVVLYL